MFGLAGAAARAKPPKSGKKRQNRKKARIIKGGAGSPSGPGFEAEINTGTQAASEQRPTLNLTSTGTPGSTRSAPANRGSDNRPASSPRESDRSPADRAPPFFGRTHT